MSKVNVNNNTRGQRLFIIISFCLYAVFGAVTVYYSVGQYSIDVPRLSIWAFVGIVLSALVRHRKLY
jgi:hypothetical protein